MPTKTTLKLDKTTLAPKPDTTPALEFLTSARTEAESALAQVHFSACILHASLGSLEKTDQAWRHALESLIEQSQESLTHLQLKPRVNEYFIAQGVRQDADKKLEEAKTLADKKEWASLFIGGLLGALVTWIVCRGGAL